MIFNQPPLKDKTIMSDTQNTDLAIDPPVDTESVKNPAALLAKNKELLRQLAGLKSELATAQDAV